MELTIKFICEKAYDFTEKGTRYVGVTVHAYDPKSDSILKCKATGLTGLKFGDDLKVHAIPNGRYINYEVA